MATYNGASFIKEQIDSILSQLTEKDELIISDDGSTDGTIDIIKSYKDTRIHIVQNLGTHGCTPNFENALRLAQGEIIFTADQDDIWEVDKVSSCLRYMEEYDFICHDACLVDLYGNVTADSFFYERGTKISNFSNIIRFAGLGCCFCFKRSILKRALPIPIRYDLVSHDNWLYLIAAIYYKTKLVPEKLIRYRRHSGAISTGSGKSNNSIWMKIYYRIYMWMCSLGRFIYIK